MGNQEFYEKKLEVISAIDDSHIKKPHHIPVPVNYSCLTILAWHLFWHLLTIQVSRLSWA